MPKPQYSNFETVRKIHDATSSLCQNRSFSCIRRYLCKPFLKGVDCDSVSSIRRGKSNVIYLRDDRPHGNLISDWQRITWQPDGQILFSADSLLCHFVIEGSIS